MREFRQRSQFRKIFFSRFVFLLLFVAATLLVAPAFNAYKKGKHAILRNDAIQEEVVEMEKRKSDLEASIGQLKTDSGIEKEIRKKFPVKKPGEEFVVIISTEDEEEILQENDQEQQEFNSFFQKLLNLFN